MNTMTIESAQTDVIRRVLEVKDISVLKKLLNLLNRETSGDDYHEKTKKEVMKDLEEAFKVAKKAQEGKMEGRPVEELLNEL